MFDPVVKRNCETTSQNCVHYIFKRLLVSFTEKYEYQPSRNRYPGRNYHKIRIRHRNEDISPLQLLYFQVTAMYYLCYWSILIDDTINEMHWSCRFPGKKSSDPLARNCIRNAVCPNPCCGSDNVRNTNDECQQLDGGICSVLLKKLTRCTRIEGYKYYKDVSVRQFAKSGPLFDCQCPETMTWNREYLTCIDKDECLSGMHNCDKKTQYCVNRVKGYFCACRWGHYPTGRYSCRIRGLQHLMVVQSSSNISDVTQP